MLRAILCLYVPPKLLKVPACVEIALLSPVQLLQFKIDNESASEET